MATFLVVLHRSGPRWDPSQPMEEQSDWPAHASFMDGLVNAGFVILGGPLADEHRVVLAVEADSEDAVRGTLARDPVERDASPGRRGRPVDDPARRAARLADARPRRPASLNPASRASRRELP